MPALAHHITVEAPADAVWEVVGRQFDRIGDWATAIRASGAVTQARPDASPSRSGAASNAVDAAAAAGPPVTGRVCHTGIRLLPQVTETIIAFDDAARTLTYQASGLPAYVAAARNTWTVTAIDERHSRVSLHARFDTRGLLGALARRVILLQVRRTSGYLADDLRHYVEHGTPSPRKQNQLNRYRNRRSSLST
jgi:hypothetical protein